MVRAIHFQDIFLFMYDVQDSANVSNDFLKPGHNVDNFKARITVAVEFQVLLQNFKASKKIDGVKMYLFWLLGVYLVDDSIHSTMLMPNKRQQGEDEWMVTPSQTRKTVMKENPLEI